MHRFPVLDSLPCFFFGEFFDDHAELDEDVVSFFYVNAFGDGFPFLGCVVNDGFAVVDADDFSGYGKAHGYLA